MNRIKVRCNLNLSPTSIYLLFSSQFLNLVLCLFRSPCCSLRFLRFGCIHSSWRPRRSAWLPIHQEEDWRRNCTSITTSTRAAKISQRASLCSSPPRERLSCAVPGQRLEVEDRKKGRYGRVAEPATRTGWDGRRMQEEPRRKVRRRAGLGPRRM